MIFKHKINQQPRPKGTGYVVLIRYLHSGFNTFLKRPKWRGIKPLSTNKKIDWFPAPDEYCAKLYYSGSNIANDNIEWWERESETERPWEPAYEYTLEPYKGLPESIPASAGPTLSSKF